jgi:Tfp pilus assembly protein PilO
MLVQGTGEEMKRGYWQKLPKDKLQKIVLICILTLIAVVGTIQFYVLKNWSALADTKNQIAKLNDQIREGERKTQQAAQDVAHRAEVKSFVEAQRAAMVSGDPFAWVVREISLLAEQEPVHMDGLQPAGKIEVKAGGPLYSARIEISGTYDQIGAYVRDLENRFPTSEIQNITVTGSADDKGRHEAALEIVLHVQPTHASTKQEAKKVS